MIIDYVIFFGLALIAVASALGMLLSRNAIYSALYLIANFITVAIFYLLLNAGFIALTQITVYAGAIMVLFLFVIMLLGAERLPATEPLPWQRPLAVILGAMLAVEAVLVLFKGQLGAMPPGPLPDSFGTPRLVGETLFGPYLLPFEVISILLLAAMVGVVVLNRRNRRTG